jgi:hypothetical protein
MPSNEFDLDNRVPPPIQGEFDLDPPQPGSQFNLRGEVSKIDALNQANYTKALEDAATADQQVAKYDNYGNYLGMGIRLAGGGLATAGSLVFPPAAPFIIPAAAGLSSLAAQYAERGGTGQQVIKPSETAIDILAPYAGKGYAVAKGVARKAFPAIAGALEETAAPISNALRRLTPGASESVAYTLPGLAKKIVGSGIRGGIRGAGIGAGFNTAHNIMEGKNPFENMGAAMAIGGAQEAFVDPIYTVVNARVGGFSENRQAYKSAAALKKVKSTITGYSEKYSPAGTFRPEGSEDQVRAVLDQMKREQRLNPSIKGISDYAALSRRSTDNLYQTRIAPVEARMAGAEISDTERQMMLIKVRQAIMRDPVATPSSKSQQVAQAEGIINGLRSGGDIFSTRKSLNQHLKDFQSGSISEQMTDLASLPTAAKKALLDELRNTAATLGDKIGGTPDYRRLLQDEARGINFRDAAENIHDASQVYDRAITSGMKPKEATEFLQKHLLNLALSGHAGVMPGTAAVAALRSVGNVGKPFKNLSLRNAEKALKPSPEYATPRPLGIPAETGGPYPLRPDTSFVRGAPAPPYQKLLPNSATVTETGPPPVPLSSDMGVGQFEPLSPPPLILATTSPRGPYPQVEPEVPPPLGGENQPPFPSPQVSATDPGWTSTMVPHAPLPSGITPEFLEAQQRGTPQRSLPLPNQENIGVYSNPAGGTTFEVPESLMAAYGTHREELGDTSFGGGLIQGLHSNVSGIMPYLERMESAGNIPRGLSSASPRNANLLNLKVGGTLLSGEASQLPPGGSLNLSTPGSVGHETTHAYQQEISPGGPFASSVGLRGTSPLGKSLPELETSIKSFKNAGNVNPYVVEKGRIQNRLLELRTRLGQLWGGLPPNDPRVLAGLYKELEAYTIGGKPGVLGITLDEATSLMNGMVDRAANEEQLKTLFKVGGQNFRDYVYRKYSDPSLNEMKPTLPPPPTEQDILDLNHLY